MSDTLTIILLPSIKGKESAKLIEYLQLQQEIWLEPCVEDQCRLVVHYAKYKDDIKNWWNFTQGGNSKAQKLDFLLTGLKKRGLKLIDNQFF